MNARTGAISQGPAPAQVFQKLLEEAVSEDSLTLHVAHVQSFNLQILYGLKPEFITESMRWLA